MCDDRWMSPISITHALNLTCRSSAARRLIEFFITVEFQQLLITAINCVAKVWNLFTLPLIRKKLRFFHVRNSRALLFHSRALFVVLARDLTVDYRKKLFSTFFLCIFAFVLLLFHSLSHACFSHCAESRANKPNEKKNEKKMILC